MENRKLSLAIQELCDCPLEPMAVDTLNHQLGSGLSNPALSELVRALRAEDPGCQINEGGTGPAPQIICSLRLFAAGGN